MEIDIDREGIAAVAEASDPAVERRFSDKDNYVLSWLSASPVRMRTQASPHIDPDKRFEAVLAVLHKERKNNILPFKKPVKK